MRTVHATDLALAVAHIAEVLDENGIDTAQFRVCNHPGDTPAIVVMAAIRSETIDEALDALEALGVPAETIMVETMSGLSARLLSGDGTTASGPTHIGLAWVGTDPS
jgi:hypothetical protein